MTTSNASSYVNAPATKMLASHCAVCGRPLCDATSVELGIGPICRGKHGYDQADSDIDPTQALAVITALAATLDPEVASDIIDGRVCDARTAANRVVYRIALDQRKCPATTRMIDALRALGFTSLADRIEKRLGEPKPKVASVDALRRSYRNALTGLTYDNASKSAVQDAVGRELEAMGALAANYTPTPHEFVEAIQRAHIKCRKCNGSGKYYGRNGRCFGDCRRCKGKGYQDHVDGHRNAAFDNHRRQDADVTGR
jgi:hypothetical protein